MKECLVLNDYDDNYLFQLPIYVKDDSDIDVPEHQLQSIDLYFIEGDDREM